MADDTNTPDTPAGQDGDNAPLPRKERRWLRRTLIGTGITVVVLGGAIWLLGRETTLQQIAERVARASGGAITITGVTGSLYNHMHIGRVVYKGKTSTITADNIDIDWSPLQFFSSGIEISELRVQSVLMQTTAEDDEPLTVPATLAPPFRISVDDARLLKLTMVGLTGTRNEVTDIRARLYGDKTQWQLTSASAITPIGRVAADGTIGAQKPFKLQAKAALTEVHIAPGQPSAQLAVAATGNLSLMTLGIKGTSPNANGDGTVTLVPFEKIPLRAADIRAYGVDPSRFQSAWPKASLDLRVKADIGTRQQVSGVLELVNTAAPGPIDQQLLPLKAVTARLGGNLTVATLDNLLIDLGNAGRFTGAGRVERTGPDGGIETADIRLHTDRIDLHHIHGAANATAIAGDISAKSTGSGTGTVQTFDVALAEKNMRLDAHANLKDTLVTIERARLQAGRGSIGVTGQASLAGDRAFKAAATVDRFDPAALGNFPKADLNAVANVAGKLVPEPNAAIGFTIRPSTFAGQKLSGSGKLNADARHLTNIAASVAMGRNTIEARGDFGLPAEKLNWKVDAKDLAALRGDLAGSVAGSGVATGGYAAPRTSFDVEARGIGLTGAKVRALDSVIRASGQFALAGKDKSPEVTLSGSARRVNPAAFAASAPAGNLNATFSGNARLAADWRANMNLDFAPSTLVDAPLTGHAKLTADHRHVDNADVDLRLGPNSLQARGAFGAPADRLNWKLDAPQLSSLGAGFGGVLRGTGTLGGTMQKPMLSFGIEGNSLRLMTQHQVRAIKATGTLGNVDALVADVNVTGYSSPAISIDRARLQSSGTGAAHSIALSAANPDFDAALRIKGGWANDTWSGTIDTLQNRGRFALTLQAPAPLTIAASKGSGVAGLAKPERIALSSAVIGLPEGSLRVENLEKNGPRWRSRGTAAGVPATYLAQLSDAWRGRVVSDLTLGANWGLDMTLPSGGAGATPSAPALNGAVRVFREKGDITVAGGAAPLPLGLSQLQAGVNVSGNTLKVQAGMVGTRAGRIALDATAQLRDGRIPGDSPLAVTASVDVPSIAWMSPLTGMEGLELEGALKAAIAGSGTVANPALNGEVSGNGLVINLADQGVRLRNGQLQARVEGDRLTLQKLHLEGRTGRADAEGWARLAGNEMTMNLKLTADKLEALSRPDRTLVLSGSSEVIRDAKRFQLNGKFRADRADIELPDENSPTISDDVVILGRTKPTIKETAQAMPLNVDLEADLGKDFRLKGKGLDAYLEGGVHVRVADRRAPRINGSIRVASGTYAAYGQKLAIERGVINFTGAYDNPGLNILAVRKRPEGSELSDTNVEAGVEVRGTALAPTARLVSTPSVPDSEKLSWLVLGHGMDDMQGNEMGLLGTAAGALFGGKGGGSFANKIGLDELGVSQGSGNATGLENTVVTVGKKLSSRAYLGFEQGAGSATSLVKLRYKLNQRITLQFQTGTNNALDVLYTWAFD
ncbi:translocation/assembly module TamB domain-containing protein [Pseudoduganella sp. SL102]|uniref:translocation/assembly module TamB domain-containing protein n=1 Tax=Pseudoduganella sp. SL102 TaxID=2995154 RepID=UPI00248CBABC|nr:translocation/assembly module TamB domain-containing protein [Pseudoduganella sp. SL102]WBS03625.1 translocation/assembly module TamB domain-containing protein [Pseudoduganella sp. SL102]